MKCVIFFASFCWLWDFLLENLKLRKKPWWCQLERLNKYKNAQSNFFKTKNSKYEILNHLYFRPVLSFRGFPLGCFIQYFLKFFRRRSTIVADIFTQPLTVKKLPKALHLNHHSYLHIILYYKNLLRIFHAKKYHWITNNISK